MYFDLTEALIDELLFFMEDQNGIFFLDTQKLIVVSDNDEMDGGNDDDNHRFIDIPKWDTSDGYRLMEKFAAGFKNPVVQDALTASLNRGKGVFRAFKTTLSQYPEAEKRWFTFKDRELRRSIVDWYNDLREDWNMEQIGIEPEETEDLVLEDFIFREYEEQDYDTVVDLHRICIAENSHYTQTTLGEPVLVALTAQQETAAFIAVKQEADNIYLNIAVKPEYRDLGIASELCSRLLKREGSEGSTSKIFIDVPAEFEGFSRFLFRSAFKPVLTQYCLATSTQKTGLTKCEN
jgi:ribosomal protein S18 acetylase RimI-like enzyme